LTHRTIAPARGTKAPPTSLTAWIKRNVELSPIKGVPRKVAAATLLRRNPNNPLFETLLRADMAKHEVDEVRAIAGALDEIFSPATRGEVQNDLVGVVSPMHERGAVA